MKCDEKLQIITEILAILFVRAITTVVVVVAHFVTSDTNTVGLASKFTLLATPRYVISSMQIQ